MGAKSVQRAALARSPSHLADGEIRAYFQAALDSAERERIELHLCACAECLERGAALVRASLHGSEAKSAAAR